MHFVLASRLSLRNDPRFTERWLQAQIAEHPSVLGLGELSVVAIERRQNYGGRLDLLLTDSALKRRYAVELQLGPLDEDHLLRAVEYWHAEHRSRPQYEHVAVVVAEEYSERLVRIADALSEGIPLIAIRIEALQVAGAITLRSEAVVGLRGPGCWDYPGVHRPNDRRHRKRDNVLDTEVVQLREEGLSQREIARELGVSKTSVVRALIRSRA
ncbi:hypothetical protein [Sinomonas halotolerans]|uniref:Winged helix-turn-helix transcriptional regulator n=1 Tax=Sinomonas halotolerans TaxID=1644133 RepID=A0ABU9WVZ6_9MICC